MPRTPTTGLPDCAWCSAANTLTVEWAEQGVQFCVCSCCAHWTRVNGVACRIGLPKKPSLYCDVNGVPMFDP